MDSARCADRCGRIERSTRDRARTAGDGIWISVWSSATPRAPRPREVERRLAAGEVPAAGRDDARGEGQHRRRRPRRPPPAARRTPTTPTRVAPVGRSALVDAGAVVVGKTNLDQFATGLVGTRSPYGICPNAHWPELIVGRVELGLGGRRGRRAGRPRARHRHRRVRPRAGGGNGIVGLKPTRGWLSTSGVVPACRSLDCVSVFARSVEVAAAAAVDRHAVPIRADPWSRPLPPQRARRGGRRRASACPPSGDLDVRRRPVRPGTASPRPSTRVGRCRRRRRRDRPRAVPRGRRAALRRRRSSPSATRPSGAFVDAHPDDVDPVVGSIIAAAGRLPAGRSSATTTELRPARAHRRDRTWDGVDVLVVPTVPRVPTVAEVLAEPTRSTRCSARTRTS